MENENVTEEYVTHPGLADNFPQGGVMDPQDQSEEIDQNQEEQSAPQEVQKPAQEVSEEDDKAYNFERLRRAKEREEERSRKLEMELEELKKSHLQDTQNFDDSIDDDDLVSGKHFIKQKQRIEKLERLIEQKDLSQVPDKLNSKFQDFNSVVSEKNLNKLEQEEPEIFASIMSTEGRTAVGLYNKGVLAYKALKRLGYGSSGNKSQANQQELTKLKAQAQANIKKPSSVQSVKSSTGTFSENALQGRLTQEIKDKLWREMTEASKSFT